ncbi:signal peptidase II [Sunxiuqinia rutila]|uniref:signal peptidase II n=1 Tax=Sunxiuqinia rutila TaxID=1397841 RepID=UPI003D35DD8D
MKTQAILIWILVLIVIDQSIKIIIFNFYGDTHFEIIPFLLEFKPTFNIKHSWVNTLLNQIGINIGLVPHVILFVAIGITTPIYFSFFRSKISSDKKLVDLATIFIMAAVVCALLGNLAWARGTLDYIYLKPLFVFDLKDVYIDFGLAAFLIYAFKNKKELELATKVKAKDVFMETIDRLRHTRRKGQTPHQ